MLPAAASLRRSCAQAFVNGSGAAGVVYTSLGTVCSIGDGEFRELAQALTALAPTRVLWKVAPDDLPQGLTLAGLGLGLNVKAGARRQACKRMLWAQLPF